LAPDLAKRHTSSTLSPETELVGRIRSGDVSACEALYRSFHEPLWRFARSFVRSSEIAEELVQEVFLALWRDRRDWDVRISIRAWLYAAVRHHALNHLRHERVAARLRERTAAARDAIVEHATTDAQPVAMGAAPLDAHASAEAQELEQIVTNAIAALPERRRLAMMLRWKHDLSAAEIATVLGTTPESVRVLLTRARQELATLLQRFCR
jgi:RNA polymerase sigma-70 factor, ECF subfamily